MGHMHYLTLFAILGLVTGSFLNVYAYRVPKGESAVKGRSYCPSCRHTLSAIELIPVLSWLFLLGKCRHCMARISPRYIVVELTTAASYMLAYWYSDSLHSAVLNCAFISVLIVVSLIDIDTREISNRAVFVILGLAILSFGTEWADGELYVMRAVWKVVGFLAVSLPMFVIAYFTDGFGGGDIKLMAAAGLYLGTVGVVLAFLVGAFLGAAYGLSLILRKKVSKRLAIAFGPCLSAGITFNLLFGSWTVNKSLALFGL